MVLRWLAESGGMQVFPPVVVLAQMCVSLCNGASPLRHSLTGCTRSGADEQKLSGVLAKIPKPTYMHWI